MGDFYVCRRLGVGVWVGVSDDQGGTGTGTGNGNGIDIGMPCLATWYDYWKAELVIAITKYDKSSELGYHKLLGEAR